MRLISDAALAICTIWMEARGEPYVGKLAVSRVIRNRTRKRYNSNGTVASTVLNPYQFSSWNTSDPNRRLAAVLDDDDPVVSECKRAWEESAQEECDAGIDDAVLYYNPDAVSFPPGWASKAKKVATIGHHIFFTE